MEHPLTPGVKNKKKVEFLLPGWRNDLVYFVRLSRYSEQEIPHIRRQSLFAPRDFNISPYFRVVKPTIECGFDYKSLTRAEPQRETKSPGREVEKLAVTPRPLYNRHPIHPHPEKTHDQ